MKTQYIEDFSKDCIEFAEKTERFLDEHNKIGSAVKTMLEATRALAKTSTQEAAERFRPTGRTTAQS
jgi:hypothetical protein